MLYLLPEDFPVAGLSAVQLSKIEFFYERYVVRAQEQYGMGHFALACYGALPAVLSPELVNKLWLNFKNYRNNGSQATIHPVAPVDLLLSPLVEEIGYELYEMSEPIRKALMLYLKNATASSETNKFQLYGLDEIAEFLHDYITLDFKAENQHDHAIREAQEWTAMSYLQPGNAFAKVAMAFQSADTNAKKARYRDAIEKMSRRFSLNIVKDNATIPEDFNALSALTSVVRDLLLNREPKNLQELLLAASSNSNLLTAAPIIGRNVINIEVPEQVGKKFLTDQTSSSINTGKLRGLIVGVAQQEPDSDASTAAYFYAAINSLLDKDKKDLKLLSGNKATKRAVLEAWNELLQEVNENDEVLFYCAASGTMADNHCVALCAADVDKPDTQELLDNEIGDAIKAIPYASFTMILQVDHSATPYWLDISDPKNVIFTSCNYDQVSFFFDIETPDGKYGAFTYALVQALEKNNMQVTNRQLFIDTLKLYEDLKTSASHDEKAPQLMCHSLALDRFFIQGKKSTVALQQLLINTGFMHSEITGLWNRPTANALSMFVKQTGISEKLNKQEYVNQLKVYDDHAAQNRFPVFLLIFSDPQKKLVAIENEKQAILKLFGKANSKVKAEVLTDPDREKLENALRKKNYRNRIELIYYSGKDDGGNFVLKDGTFDFLAFAPLLVFQKNIKLLVSNTCRSELFADYSTQVGIARAIGTHGQILDSTGAEFGEKLFQWIFDGKDLESFMDWIEQRPKEGSDWQAFKLFKSRWNAKELKTTFNLPVYEDAVTDTGEVFSLIILFDNYPFLGKHTAVPESHLLQSWLKKNYGSQNCMMLGSFSGNLPNKDDVDSMFNDIISLALHSSAGKRTLVVYVWGRGLMLENGEIVFFLPGISDTSNNDSLSIYSYLQALIALSLFNEVLFFYDLEKPSASVAVNESAPEFDYPGRGLQTSSFLLGNLSDRLAEVASPDGSGGSGSVGLFTKKLVEAFNGKAADENENITALSTLRYLRDVLPAVAGEINAPPSNDVNLSVIFKKSSPDCSIRFSNEHSGKTVVILNDRLEEVYSMIINSHSLELQLLPGSYRMLITDMQIDNSFAIKVSEGSVTIDLSRKFRNQYICVIGSGSDLTETEIITAKVIGRFLAQQGFRLITGGWPGVDQITSQAYYEVVNLYGEKKVSEYLLQVVEEGRVPEFTNGSIEFVSGENWERYVMEKSFTFISIGGRGYTYEMFEHSQQSNASFIPLPFTGGDSRIIFDTLTTGKGSELLAPMKATQTANDEFISILSRILDQVSASKTRPDILTTAEKVTGMALLSEMEVKREEAVSFVQLLEGDLASIPKEHAVDILVISAYPGSYSPVPGSLIAALYNKGIMVEGMARDKEVDLTAELGCWLSKPLNSKQQDELNFKRILCFEPYHHSSSPEALVGNIFRCINTFAFDEHNSTIALPVLASGNQKVPIDKMLPAIIDMAILWLRRGLPFNYIKLAINTPQQVATALPIFTEAKNKHNGVPEVVSTKPSTTYDFFLSFAQSQQKLVQVFVTALLEKNKALTIFYDKSSIPPGGLWLRQISDAITNSKKVLIFMSPEYSNSMVCWDEFQCAKLKEYNEKTSVIQTIYLNTDVNLPPIMGIHAYIDCREGDVEKLKAAAYQIAAPTELFISYAWGSESEQVADSLFKVITDRGLRVTRDKMEPGYKGNIKNFTQALAPGKYVIIIISDQYLKSENCMLEMFELQRNSRIYERIFPIVLNDAKIYDDAGRIDYISYWINKREALKPEIETMINAAEAVEARKKINQYGDILAIFDKITVMLRNMNTQTPDVLKQNNFSELINAIDKQMVKDGYK